jgi:hypothetical protein
LAHLVDDTEKVPFNNRINLSFGSSTTEGAWNALEGFTVGSGTNDLKDIYSDITDVDVVVTERFCGVNQDGPTATATELNMPGDVSKKSFFGNKKQFGGIVTATAKIKFTSLDKDKTYDFAIFGSRMKSEDNKETYYKFSGKTPEDTILYLNISNNNRKLVKAIGIAPNDDGEIELEVGPGPNNDNSHGFYYITALSFAPHSVASSAVNEPVHFSLNAYPNPVLNQLYTRSESPLTHIEIYNYAGVKVMSKSLDKETNFSTNVDYLPSGVYFIRAEDINQNQLIEKIIKQ